MTDHTILESTVSITRLRELRQRFLAEETSLDQALTQAIASLEQWEHMLRMMLIDHNVSSRRVKNLCRLLDDSIEAIQRDLVDVRAALVGLDEEIILLEHVHERRAAIIFQRQSQRAPSGPSLLWSR